MEIIYVINPSLQMYAWAYYLNAVFPPTQNQIPNFVLRPGNATQTLQCVEKGKRPLKLKTLRLTTF